MEEESAGRRRAGDASPLLMWLELFYLLRCRNVSLDFKRN